MSAGRRRVLVLFPDEWDVAAARDPALADRYEFLFEGFDLFRFPGNLRLFAFDALAFVDRLARRYARRRVEAVTSSDEQFGPFLAALLAQRLGLPHAPVEAVVGIQHKFYARRAFDRIAPEANARFGLLRRGFASPREVPLPFPFYVKPVKAAFSVLARRVASFEELRRHAAFGALEAAIIERLVRPFADVMRACTPFTEDPFSMVCEEIARGAQVTVNGYVRRGKATVLGTVDSIMYPGTDHFRRFQYPSSLPAAQLARVESLAARLAEGMELGHGMFNTEVRLDPASGEPRVIEINPRAAGQFYDLFARVDGYSLFEALLELECGDAPRVRKGAGPDRVAASFVLRDFSGAGLGRWPSAPEIEALRARHPGTHLMVYPKRGADLARELKWLGSYRYAVFNAGGASVEEMTARFAALCADITFHPRGLALPEADPQPAALLG
ncbi:MAG TPA: ATP-grasp domain-containing protein, partial [Usitatibacter sp.]|nr:ATP-grasp domain-containing protein [Usitatibacter sp.]